MAIFDRLFAAFKPASKEAPAAEQETQPAQQEGQAQEQEPEANTQVEADPAKLEEMSKQLEAIVYDPELATELAPAFVAMSAVEGFDKVMELFAAKEKQIEALNVGGQEQQSTPAVQEKESEADAPKSMSATDILRERAKAQKQTQSQ